MRINKWLAAHSSLSRRKADESVTAGRVRINDRLATIGSSVNINDKVYLDDKLLLPNDQTVLLMLNKPVGYVCSRRGQGSKTIYELLPEEYRNLKPVGRLDKDSSGLLLLTNDGDLLHSLSHPSQNHTKKYLVTIDLPLDYQSEVLLSKGVDIGEARASVMKLKLLDTKRILWQVELEEGRKRQIRRSFEAVERQVIDLHRTNLAEYNLGSLESGEFAVIKTI